MAFVSESLEKFLAEWVNQDEDRWADREIDKYFKREEGVNLNEDPVEILTYPEEVEPPADNEAIKRILLGLIEYKKGQDVTPEEFKNFCIWTTHTAKDPQHASAIVSAFIDQVQSLYSELETTPDGGKYHEGLEILSNKFRRQGPSGPPPIGPETGRDM